MNHSPDNLARVFKVLAVGTRVRIVQLLHERALCVNALAARLDITQGAVSQHLRVMRDANLVIDERRGYHVHYRLNEETLARCPKLVPVPTGTGARLGKAGLSMASILSIKSIQLIPRTGCCRRTVPN